MQTLEAMHERRQRILARARKLLAGSDAEAFSVRNLAAAANVSATTIYNLIGDKNTLMLEICIEMVADIERQVEKVDDEHILEKLEAGVMVTTDLADPAIQELRRAANIAFDNLSRQGAYKAEIEELTELLLAGQQRIIRRGQISGKLKGAISAEILSRQILNSQMKTLLDWTYRHITLGEYRKRCLLALYVILAADASPPLYQTLIGKIGMLEAR
ncbi:TetR/AcrR family transcriptional regulator [Emcibacter sp. SYSU 3D8]|uniref:TetR/AcrR family transcriptional regulator n=1 Tax=Emcibacter sp. SYSU 3D8 TaxID=3133969 RepID=UPI0031FE883C